MTLLKPKPPKPKKIKKSWTYSQDVLERLDELHEKTGMSRIEIIELLIRNARAGDMKE